MPNPDGMANMARPGNSKNIGLWFLIGCVVIAVLVVLGLIIYRSTKNDNPDSADEWTEVGNVVFCNEYGINPDLDKDYAFDVAHNLAETYFADEIEAAEDVSYNPEANDFERSLDNMEAAKVKERGATRILISFFSTKDLNDLNPKLYRKSMGGTNMYEIRGNGKILPVETGSFVSLAGDAYNARVSYTSGNESGPNYHYFSIFE